MGGCFTLLLTYKVLKLVFTHKTSNYCFTLLLTYKVLKQRIIAAFKRSVLHSY